MVTRLLTSILPMALVGTAWAQEMNFTFRNIPLNATLDEVSARAPAEFEQVRGPRFDGAIAVITAGDAEGIQKDNCPEAAPSQLRKNCLIARISAREDGGLWRVKYIGIQQSFNPPVPANLFLARLTNAYGKPRATYEPRFKDMKDYAVREQNFVWGGKYLPKKNYEQSMIPWEDFELIQGKHLTLKLVTSPDGEKVTGYQLRMADADFLLGFEKKFKAQLRAEKEKEEKANADKNIRF